MRSGLAALLLATLVCATGCGGSDTSSYAAAPYMQTSEFSGPGPAPHTWFGYVTDFAAGPVTVDVWPGSYLLQLYSGDNCENLGPLVAESDTGTLSTVVQAGYHCVRVGNPTDHQSDIRLRVIFPAP